MKDKKWLRLLTYVTGLMNQELLLQNEYLAAKNRILRAHRPARLRLSDSSTMPVTVRGTALTGNHTITITGRRGNHIPNDDGHRECSVGVSVGKTGPNKLSTWLKR